MKHLKTYNENINKFQFIGAKCNNLSDLDKFRDLGYNTGEYAYIGFTNNNLKEYEYIWIRIDKENENDYGRLFLYYYNEKTDLLLDINDIPKRKDLDEYVKYLEEGNKMGLI